jgi:pyruvate/2-oxoglutarate dehydrogenase complex dihydrolipoamide acyltransferase (E2) component
MLKEVVMPKLALSMSYGILTEWHVKVGDRVRKGDVIGTIETDKVMGDITAPCDGVIKELLAQPGDERDALATIAYIEES